MRLGTMVRVDGSGPLMKTVDERDGEVCCIWFDHRGAIHRRYYEPARLAPFWLSTGPKSVWPDVTQLDVIALEKEERDAKEARKVIKKAARKSRRSHRIKG